MRGGIARGVGVLLACFFGIESHAHAAVMARGAHHGTQGQRYWVSRFVLEYAKCGVAVEAYRRAGYTAKGNAAEDGASVLLRNPKIAAELAKLSAKAEKRGVASVEECFELWSEAMRDTDADWKDRLKAMGVTILPTLNAPILPLS